MPSRIGIFSPQTNSTPCSSVLDLSCVSAAPFAPMRRLFPRVGIELLLESVMVRNIVLAEGDAGAQHKNPALFGNMPQRREPRLAPIPRGGDVNLHAPGVHAVARERHVIFPADQPRAFAPGGGDQVTGFVNGR